MESKRSAQIVSQEAASWYLRVLDQDALARPDRDRFLRWLKQSPENVAEILRIAHIDGGVARRRLLDKVASLTDSTIHEIGIWGLNIAHQHDYGPIDGLGSYRSRVVDRICLRRWLLLAAWSVSTSIGLLHLAWSILAAYGVQLPDEITPIYQRILLLLLFAVAMFIGALIGAFSLVRDERVAN